MHELLLVSIQRDRGGLPVWSLFRLEVFQVVEAQPSIRRFRSPREKSSNTEDLSYLVMSQPSSTDKAYVSKKKIK